MTDGRWLDDVDIGAWIALDDAWMPLHKERSVASLVPRTFDAFARVFHPLYLPRPLLEVAGNRYVLFELPIAATDDARLLNPEFSPNLVWPADRSWFLHTALDDLSTYVAGSAEAISSVLEAAELESARVYPDDPAW